MIIKSLRLRGFKGIKSGMGIEELFLDLSTLPDGLISITGANGVGKSTVLDSLQPFRLQPYKCRKSKDWSPNSFSFYDQTFGNDAMKELFFSMGDRDYRSLVLIDVPRRKQEAYLYRRDGDQWVPLCDGKTGTYDDAIEAVCGSPSLFFSSVFRAQGAKNLSDYTRGDIMQIISELLNIDHVRLQGEKCRAVVAGLTAGLTLGRDRMVALSAESDRVTGLVDALTNKKLLLDADRLSLVPCRDELVAIRAESATIREQQAAQESEAARLVLIRSQYADEARRSNEGQAAFDKALAAIDTRIALAVSARDASVAALQTKIDRAAKIVSGAEGIRKAVTDSAGVSAALDNERVRLGSLQTTRDEAARQVAGHQTDLVRVAGKLAACQKDVAKLDGLDCRADASGWLNPTCRFIADAVTSQAALPALVAEHGALVEDCSATLALASADMDLEACRVSIRTIEASLAELQKFTRLLPELELAETSLVGWQQEIVELGKRVADEIASLGNDKWCLEAEWDLVRSGFIARTDALRLDIEAFPPVVDLADALRDLSLREGASLSAIAGFETRIRGSDLDIVALQTKLDAAQAKGDELVLLQAKDGRVSAEIAKFSLLMRACSSSGIIALEVDDAGPSISAIVNDLLRACYGSRFAVRFDTQAEKVNGDTKEVFDIRVMDNDSGNEMSITECSGGQLTVIEDAITRGICLFNIHRSDRIYGTLYSDEKDGALDEARKLEFMRVKREALRVGTHRQEYFISQTQDLVEMADARIVLAPGGVAVM